MPRKSSRPGLGPGIVIAATGMGAGDLIAAAVAGASYGVALVWAVLLGALLKYCLNEGLARWQLATGITLIEGWFQRLPRFLAWYFLVYLLLWSFIVAAALMSACGLAAHALFPQLEVATWGLLHSVAAFALVWFGRYRLLEPMMKIFVGLMFVVVLYCAALTTPDWAALASALITPRIPEGSITLILGVIGGVGGSVTLLSYGYWIREHGWRNREALGDVRRDLIVAYSMTALFGVAIMIISAGIRPEVAQGSRMALAIADELLPVAGPTAKWLFLAGFWGAVFSSMIGVWQGVPYLFADCIGQLGSAADTETASTVSTRSPTYRIYLAYLALPPALLLFSGKPVWLILMYAVAGAFFMPLLAGLLLFMNNRANWVGQLRNRLPANLVLACALLLFAALAITKLARTLT